MIWVQSEGWLLLTSEALAAPKIFCYYEAIISSGQRGVKTGACALFWPFPYRCNISVARRAAGEHKVLPSRTSAFRWARQLGACQAVSLCMSF
uniref:Secreted protein n=1 Tax=Arundo donax TaxID=35708 RepID=A0A0A9FER3_ARUDO